LVLGGWIFLARKGTRAHVRAGWGYVASMACLNGTAFALYNLTGGFNVFHALALFSLATVAAGVIQVLGRRRWRRWLWRHSRCGAWPCGGPLGAPATEGFGGAPPLRPLAARTAAPLPLLVMACVVAASGVVIFAMQRRVLARYGGGAEPPAAV